MRSVLSGAIAAICLLALGLVIGIIAVLTGHG